MLSGSIVAIVTPMHADGSLDLNALRRLIDLQIESGTRGIVVVGTTGESPTVNFDEHCELIKTTVVHVAGRVPVIAGTGANSTQEAIELTLYAAQAGVDYCLSVVPYYNKPTQEGLFLHFKRIAESADVPLILYNVPSRTACDLSNDTILRLAQVPNIVGLKDATSDMARGADLVRRLAAVGRQNFFVLSGNDDTTLALMSEGGVGVISVTANVAPREMAELCAAALEGNYGRARAINQQLMSLHLKLFVEPNPTPVKWALQEMGLINSGIRLPLLALSAQHRDTVRAAMREAGLLKKMETV